jgi:hypothetical protein
MSILMICLGLRKTGAVESGENRAENISTPALSSQCDYDAPITVSKLIVSLDNELDCIVADGRDLQDSFEGAAVTFMLLYSH